MMVILARRRVDSVIADPVLRPIARDAPVVPRLLPGRSHWGFTQFAMAVKANARKLPSNYLRFTSCADERSTLASPLSLCLVKM